MAAGRALAAIVVALAAGLALARVDSRPAFDDTGVMAVALALAAFVVVLLDGSARALRAAMLAVLVGIWIPVLELSPVSSGPLLALGFAAAGAGTGLVALRASRGGG